MPKVTINDVADADQNVEEILLEMREQCDDDVYLSTKAVCAAIQAFGLRLDYLATSAARMFEGGVT